jgi:hypothetical protein
MDAADLSVDELTAWMRIPLDTLALAKRAAATAGAVKAALLGIYTTVPVGIWWNTTTQKLAVCRDDPAATAADLERVKAVMAGIAPVTIQSGAGDPAQSIKLSFSPTIRRVGEMLNFFPGKYPGGIPNQPGPVNSMLTSGLIGAGLGYGAGTLGAAMLPEGWNKERLPQTLAMLGGAAGAAPGALWGGINKAKGLRLDDNQLLYHRDDEPPAYLTLPKAGKFDGVELGPQFKAACDRFTETLVKSADAQDFSAGPAPAVNVDALGRTLWETGSNNPPLAATTFGAVMAAGQMPGGDDSEWVTPMQMGELAARMGAGYLSGAVVGKTLGLLTGMPEAAQNRLKRTGQYTAILEAVVPRLFGR